jgi:stress response protein YsnF
LTRSPARAHGTRRREPAGDSAAPATAAASGRGEIREGEPVILPLVEEQVAVGRRKVRTATIRVRKIVRERVAAVDEAVVHEDVVVERIPVDRVVPGAIPPRHEGDTLILSVIEEVLVKQLRLVEEVRITKRRRIERRRTTMPLRREDIVVERSQPAASTSHQPREA